VSRARPGQPPPGRAGTLCPLGAHRRGMPLKQGDKAPDFSLLDQDGKTVKLVDLKGAGRSSCTSTHNG
jgi:hypothetical protein